MSISRELKEYNFLKCIKTAPGAKYQYKYCLTVIRELRFWKIKGVTY